MILIIDAYNVLKTMHAVHVVTPRQVRDFTTRLFNRAAGRGYVAYIVFDGGGTIRAREERSNSGAIMYAGTSATADDLIYQLAEELRGKEVVVVSADRALRSRSSKVGAKLLEPAVLWRVLFAPECVEPLLHKNTRPAAPATVVPNSAEPTELAQLLATAPCDLYDKDGGEGAVELRRAERVRSGYTESKETKRMARIVERL